jgi:hypothetical protein
VNTTTSRILAITAFVTMLATAGVLLGTWISHMNGSGTAESNPMPPDLTAADFWPNETGVLHFIRTKEVGWAGSGDKGQAETWFDPRNLRARVEVHWSDGGLQGLSVANDAYYAEYGQTSGDRDAPANVHELWLGKGEGWNRWLASGSTVIYAGWLSTGAVEYTEASLDGKSVLVVTVPMMGDSGEREGNKIIYLDEQTQLPLRIETNGVQNSVEDITYSLIEWLPQSKVDADLFQLPDNLPNVISSSKQRDMTVEEAKNLRGIDAYFLGDTFQGLTVLNLSEYESQSDLPIHYFKAEYSSAEGGPIFVSVTTYVQDPTRKDPWNTPDEVGKGEKRDVTVQGNKAYLYREGGQSEVWFQTVGSVVRIAAKSDDQVLAAGEVLQRLN